jgi:hypothetical protein
MGRTPLVFSVIMLSLAQAGSQEWQRFGIERFGFVFDVPPEFELTQRSDSGDGAAFHAPDGALLAVWGINLEEDDFLAQVKEQISRDEKEGWEFTYRRLTREWASYSGVKADQIRYVRAITVCGNRAALFLMDYSRDKKVAYDPVVTRMVRSLKPEDC